MLPDFPFTLTFYPANFLSPDDIQSVQEQVRKRVVRLFQRRGYLNSDEASGLLCQSVVFFDDSLHFMGMRPIV